MFCTKSSESDYLSCKYHFEAANKIRRFGIDEHGSPGDAGRSMLTPIPDVYNDVTEPPAWVEDWQTYAFGGYTAADVSLRALI